MRLRRVLNSLVPSEYPFGNPPWNWPDTTKWDNASTGVSFLTHLHLLKDDGIYIVEDILDDGGHLEYVKHNIANLNILNMNHMRSADNHQDNILGLWYNDDVLSKQEEICQKNIQKN